LTRAKAGLLKSSASLQGQFSLQLFGLALATDLRDWLE